MDSGTLITIIVVVVLVLIALGLVLLLRRNRTRKPNSHRATGPRETEGEARARRADAADPSARYGRHDIRATEHTTEQPGVIQDRDDEVDDAEPQQT
jgi:hypothetical protein